LYSGLFHGLWLTVDISRTRLERTACQAIDSRSHVRANPMAKPTKEQIIHRAYELWEENNKPQGRDQEFYLQAERQLEGEEQLKDMPEDF
jgi:hypothetical protein